MTFRLLDHTADVGFEVRAPDLQTLYARAAGALIELITDRRRLRSRDRLTLAVDGADRADLMVNWLREVLYLWNGEEKLVGRIDIRNLAPRRLRADIGFERYDPARHEIRREVKAVTYHQVRVEKESTGWSARIILDV